MSGFMSQDGAKLFSGPGSPAERQYDPRNQNSNRDRS
jgi:hypothetical protein